MQECQTIAASIAFERSGLADKRFQIRRDARKGVPGSDSFAVEQGKAADVVEWMNTYAKKNNQKFEARLVGYSMQTIKFGIFEFITWSGDWSVARSITKKASSKLGAKVIESGYHERRDLLSAMFGGAEHGKIYSKGNLVGQIELDKKSGRWVLKNENFI